MQAHIDVSGTQNAPPSTALRSMSQIKIPKVYKLYYTFLLSNSLIEIVKSPLFLELI